MGQLRSFRLDRQSAWTLLLVALFAAAIGFAVAVVAWPRAGADGVSARQGAYERELMAHQLRMDRAYQGRAVDWLLLGDSQLQAFPADLLRGKVVNFAIGGEATNRLADRLGHYSLLRTAKTIVLASGSNDLREGRDVDAVLAAWQRALTRIPPESTLICVGVFPRRLWHPAEHERRTTLNQRIEQACAARAARFIDPYALLTDGQRLLRAEFDDGDGMHLTGTAYQRLAQALAQSLTDIDVPGLPGPPNEP